MTRGALALFLAAALFTPAARAAPPPVFQAFTSFCFDTGARPDAAAAAIRAAGGEEAGAIVPSYVVPDAGRAWNVTVSDVPLRVTVETFHPSDAILAREAYVVGGTGGAQARMRRFQDVTCRVEMLGRDDAGAAALRRWARVAPYYGRARPTVTEDYAFASDSAGRRTGVPAGRAGVLESEGRLWSLEIWLENGRTIAEAHHAIPLHPER
jgi:hypothetical protein